MKELELTSSIPVEIYDNPVRLHRLLAKNIEQLRRQHQAFIRETITSFGIGSLLVGLAIVSAVNRSLFGEIVSLLLLAIWVGYVYWKIRDLSKEILATNKMINLLSGRLDELMHKNINIEVIAQDEIVLVSDEYQLTGYVNELTPDYLQTKVYPYVNAIADVQHLIDEIQGRQYHDVIIRKIVQRSPISVSLDGASEAIQVIKESVVPWRRKHAETMARLVEQEKKLEIEIKKAEYYSKRVLSEKERQEAQLLMAKSNEEITRMKLENEKLKLEIQRERVQLALDLLVKISPNLSEAEKIAFIAKLLSPLDVLIFNEVGISIENKKVYSQQ